jgi:hypothetical protein
MESFLRRIGRYGIRAIKMVVCGNDIIDTIGADLLWRMSGVHSPILIYQNGIKVDDTTTSFKNRRRCNDAHSRWIADSVYA